MKSRDAAQIIKSLLQNGELARDEHAPSLTKEALQAVLQVLVTSPNVELEQAQISRKTENLAAALRALIALSKYDKKQWISIIEEYGLSVDLNPRASTRDVLGKVLSYLEDHPEVLKQKPKASKSKPGNTNLEDTLTKLIGYK